MLCLFKAAAKVTDLHIDSSSQYVCHHMAKRLLHGNTSRSTSAEPLCGGAWRTVVVVAVVVKVMVLWVVVFVQMHKTVMGCDEFFFW